MLLVAASAVGFPAAGAADLSPQEMEAGRKLDATKCAKCHKHYDPSGYEEAEWKMWMEKMTKKSKLKADQATLLTRYFAAKRGAGQTGGK
jgi:hypothetical protein